MLIKVTLVVVCHGEPFLLDWYKTFAELTLTFIDWSVVYRYEGERICMPSDEWFRY